MKGFFQARRTDKAVSLTTIQYIISGRVSTLMGMSSAPALLPRGYSHIFINVQAKSLRRNEETGGGITEKDPLKVAKNVYKFVMENDRVRVLEVQFKPGEKAAMHTHPDHVVYVLKGGKAKMTSSGKTDTLDLKTGQAIFLKAQSHEAENTGKTDLDLLVVELKK